MSAFSRPGMRAGACEVRQPGRVITNCRKPWKAAIRVFVLFSLSWRAAALTTRGTSKRSMPEVEPASSTAIASPPSRVIASTSEVRAAATWQSKSLKVLKG